MQVLLFQAIELPGGNVLVPPPFAVDGDVGPQGDSPADLVVELLGEADDVLVRHRVPFASPCAVPSATAGKTPERPPRIAQALVAHHAKARALRVSQWGRVVHERKVDAAPVVDVGWPPATALGGASATLSWSCGDPQVFGLWQFSNDGKNWTSLTLPQPAGATTIDLRALPGGTACQWRLLVCDGVQTHRFDSAPFTLKARGWIGLLLAPANGARVDRGIGVELVGQGYEMEKRLAEFSKLSWSSSIDGELGGGHRLHVRLTPGKHRITLSVLGKAARSIDVVVG